MAKAQTKVGTCTVTTEEDGQTMSVTFTVPIGDDFSMHFAAKQWLELYEKNIRTQYGPLAPMKLKLADGGRYTPKDSDPVTCDIHGVTVKWGDLSPVQQLAVSEGLDVDGPDCIMLPQGN